MNKKLLALDLSTTCTGYAFFNVERCELLSFGVIKPTKKGLAKLTYPKKQLFIMRDISKKIIDLIKENEPEALSIILIEEINRSISRTSQKTLDGFHYILVDYLEKAQLVDRVKYKDSDGKTGWRSKLGLVLSADDKKMNEKHRQINSKKRIGSKDLVIINKKHLAARKVNELYGTDFDVEESPEIADMVDAIGLGTAYLQK